MDFTHDCSGCDTKGADWHYSSLLYRIPPSASQYRIHSSLQIFEHSAFAFPGIQNAIATFIRVYGSLSSYKLITNLNREPFTRRCFRKGLLISVGRRASTLPTFPESSAYHSAAYRPKCSAYLHRRAELHHVLPI